MRRVLIVNPGASRVTEARLAAVEGVLAPVEVWRTEGPGHGVELAREAGAATVFVLGGDGTFNEVLNGCDPGATLGFLPAGGTNVLPRALGLPADPVAAARALAGGVPRRISLGRVNGRRFGFASGIGLDAELLRRAGRTRRGRRRSDLGVVAEALRILAERRGRFEPALEIRGHGEAAFALVANAEPYTYVGGTAIRVTRGAAFELGLDFVAPNRLRLRDYPSALRYLASGGGRLDLVRGHDIDCIEVACREPMPLQADGEDLGDVTDAVFEAERDAVAVLVSGTFAPG
ncbi:MAG TPA: diacylglycerol kinase family protein [Gaiellaceae bacterium]|jgi:diacylglycerol kinase family enzyme|nr:diacylglycerol kinase family protein [Gaiellaceae bacterium]